MSTAETGIIVSSPSQKKWYEDEEQQEEFSRAGVGFDAISVKMQQLYEIGILKLFIESEILKSNTGAFEPGFKELYSPYSMTVPQRIGKDLLFTSDIEFSDSGFVSGSLENDKKKIFLNRNEFTNYLLRLPKPISDIETPLDEKRDMNAYKYLQVLGTEVQDKILFLCDNFIQSYNQQYKQNANDISRIQKEVNDLKRLAGPGITSDDVQKRVVDKEKQLVQVKNVKIQLETKRANYKNACAILSNSTRRSQYNASLLAAYPAIKNDASSYSTTMIDWFKFKHNASNGSIFFKQVCRMFKPIIPKEMLTKRQEILIAIQEVATKLGELFKPIFETFFFTELNTLTRSGNFANIIPNVDYRTYFINLNTQETRQTDPQSYSWLNADAMFKKIISETRFTDYFYKTELERLQSIAKLMSNFNSNILTLFSLFKFEKNLSIFIRKPNDNKNVFERAEQDDDFFKRAENVNMLFQNVFYLKHILEIIGRNLVGRVDFINKIVIILETIATTLFPKLNEYLVKVQRYDYDTLLGTASHSGFVENAFTGKVSSISHYHKNNKFLVSSEFIQNSPVTITIPDGNYTLETLSSVVENALCSTCKWTRRSEYEANMLWRCKYDSNNFLQLRLYFPFNNIHTPGLPGLPPNIPNISLNYYTFTISSGTNMNAGTTIPISIPEGEYKNISQVLDAMQKTINDVITKPGQDITTPFTSRCKITLEVQGGGGELVTFYLEPPLVRVGRRVETLTITLSQELSDFLSQNPAITPISLNTNNNIGRSLPQPPRALRLSKTITIDTRTKIDGEEYNASEIFGVTQRTPGSIQFFPDITTNALQISDNHDSNDSNKRRDCDRTVRTNFQSCIFLSDILNSTLGVAIANDALMDFGILNFTSKRINDEMKFKAVDMKDIDMRANADVNASTTRNVFKNDILEKTGVYMNNHLLNPKVPVITPVDILNSILYRYPCIPSPRANVKEGSTEFDEFIEERVNTPDFNAVVCLGKCEKDQTPSLTLRNVLKKTLMYDESDDRRNKLLCDLHYAICGPVYVDINPSREINRLTMIDQFTLQVNRPNVIVPGQPPPPPPNPWPFAVKGITQFYDYDKEYYKYLIYGEYTVETDAVVPYTYGGIKYYDPGEKVGTGNLNASELYDVLQTTSYQHDGTSYVRDSAGNNIPISSIIHNVIWMPNNSNTSHQFDEFIIIGEFQNVEYRNKENEVIEIHSNPNPVGYNYTYWRMSHIFPTPPSPPAVSYFNEADDSINVVMTIRRNISNLLRIVRKFDTNVYTHVIFSNGIQGDTSLFLPYYDMSSGSGVFVPNQILNDVDGSGAAVPYKVSCGVVSVNKTVNDLHSDYRFYHIMGHKYAASIQGTYADANKTDITTNKYRTLSSSNPLIQNNLLWLGLKEKTTLRKILSCTLINVLTHTVVPRDIPLPIVFDDGDMIENIRVDVNNPEIVTVFGKFKATVSDTGPSARPNKVIRNVMVIYTNAQNDVQNDSTFGTPTYSLGYDNFKGITVNEHPEFTSLYSCVDGLIPASIDKGTMQQNIGILTVRKTQSSEVSIIGFHNTSVTTVSDMSTVKEGAIPATILCYDYNMCADSLKIEVVGTPPTHAETKIENGVFNPVTFYAFYVQKVNYGGLMKPMTSLSKGMYALIRAKNPKELFSPPSNLHVLNTWGIDLSSSQTLFYKRIYEPSKNSTILKFNMKAYEKYMNDIIDTILMSAKSYYEQKVKPSFYEYGAIDGNPPILFKRVGDSNAKRNIVVGGGKEEDAAQILLSTEYVVEEEMANKDIKNRKNITRKKIVEIRIPDIMMSDEYISAITPSDRKNAIMIFVNSIFACSKQLYSITTKQNEFIQQNRGADNNLVILDEYQIVLCSKNETIQNRFNEIKAIDAGASTKFLTLSDNVFDFEMPSSSTSSLQLDKDVILVNEWNDKGFIGDYGAYAYSDTKALTPNQLIVSSSQQIVTEATAVKEAVTRGVPKYPNTAFLLNPVFSYYTLDPSKWVAVNSLFEKSNQSGERESGIQIGGAGPLYPGSSYGLPMQDPFLYSRSQVPPNLYGYDYGYGQQPGIMGPRGYGYGYDGYGYGENGNELVRMKRKVLDSSDIPSKNMKKINLQTMQTDTRFKKVVLWLFDSRENKMLLTKTRIGKNKVVLSLPVQNQQVGTVRASGYSLLQQLCRRLFNQADIIRKWTLEISYAYEDDANIGTGTGTGITGITGIFIYSAKSYDLPKPTPELIYVNMQAVLNLTKGAIIIKNGSRKEVGANIDGDEKGNDGGSQLEINSRDVALIGEVFRVVPLIQGGIISSTSKEFNEIVASLVSKTPHQHLRSSISEKKRRENVEKNVQFLINLFFPQNSLFFVRGQLKYYIYSTQRSCKIFTIVKQPGYDDDSYLTCLKLFLQSEYDYKQKLSTFRVGCSVKKKLIADNFSSVWDSFWNDLIDSQEQDAKIKQIEDNIGSAEVEAAAAATTGEIGEDGGKTGIMKENDRVTTPVCLNDALTTCKRMYNLAENWNASSYYPLAYDGILYNLDPAKQQYGFNNEYYYNLENLQTNQVRNAFFGFKCMKYNDDSENPILYLGGTMLSSTNVPISAVFEYNLKTKNIKRILYSTRMNSEILCIDIIGRKHLFIGGSNIDTVSVYKENAFVEYQTTVPFIIINIETYDVTMLYDTSATPPRIDNPNPNQTKVNKICICKNRKVIDTTQTSSYYEYIGLFGGNIRIETGGVGANPNIINIGCVVVKIPVNESNPLVVARMFCIDEYIETSTDASIVRGFSLLTLPSSQNVNITSIICDDVDDQYAAAKNKTTFYVGGYFNTFGYVDYDSFKKAQAEATSSGSGVPVNQNGFIKNGNCNSILKLSITSNYSSLVGGENGYRNQCAFELIETNSNKNNIIFNASLALHTANSNHYLLAFTAFFDKTEVPTTMNTSTVTTAFNTFNLKTGVNAQIAVAVPNSRSTSALPDITKDVYRYQCLAVVEDVLSKKHIAVMSYTINNGTTDVYAYSFTCELNMETQAALQVVESTCNDEAVTSQYNSVTDVCGIKNKNGNQIDIYVSHENISISPVQILYPLTVKSNYQQIGSWNVEMIPSTSQSNEPESTSTFSKETEIFFRFVDSIIELGKIYKEYPSTILFLQNIDYRDKNEKITRTELQRMYDELLSKTSFDPASILEPKVIQIENSCNSIFLKLNFMLELWSMINTSTDILSGVEDATRINITLFGYIKRFYDSFIFLLIYAGCVNLAQLLCKNYTASVLSNANGRRDDIDAFYLTKLNIKSKFMTVFTTVGFGDENVNNKFKNYFSEKARLYDPNSPNIVICSDPHTYTGVAYVARHLDQNLSMRINGDAKQKALQHKIYKSNEDFFIKNNDFFTTTMASDSINTIDLINYSSFYKFQRLKIDGIPFRTNFGAMTDTTIYACVNINVGSGSNIKMDSGKVLEFLKLVINYFKRLPSGTLIADIGIGGPIKRIIFGGDFGCNLLHDSNVCSDFTKNGMKIYTTPKNVNAFTDNTNDSGNQMFVIDANVMGVSSSSSSSSSLVGGGHSNSNIDLNENKHMIKRLNIGEPISNDKKQQEDGK
jgi:hypothetical protein